MVSRVSLAQPDARHHYAMARFLHRRGMLQRLYTDFALAPDSLAARVLEPVLPAALRAKLRRRYIDDIPAARIRSGFGLKLPGMVDGYPVRTFSRQDLRESDAFYCQYFAGGAQLRARRISQPLISDVFIVPSVDAVLDGEIDRFPDWGEQRPAPAHRARRARHVADMVEHSDFLFCPSQAVLDELSALRRDGGARAVLVPYGAGLRAPAGGAVVPGRVLFCGQVGLRKGVQYIAQAADLLRDSHPELRFVFAGHAGAAARAQLARPNVTVLGQLSKEAVAEEFGRADIFLFPSLAEGAAGVMFEALASGVPVVATRAAGVAFTDGASGIVVPERDPEAIAAAVLRIYGDRTLRAAMAASAAREAVQYGLPCWEERFTTALAEIG